jgi:hypothetical protein
MFIMRCSLGSECFEWVKTIAPVIVTVIFGAIAGAITWRQYQVAHAKLKLDLFERRYAIFSRTHALLSRANTVGAMTDEVAALNNPFGSFIAEARFLFGRQIEAYLKTASANFSELWAIALRTDDNNDVVPIQDIQRRTDLVRWFVHQSAEGAQEVFGPYLDFENWK